jgi:hypothetical protein
MALVRPAVNVPRFEHPAPVPDNKKPRHIRPYAADSRPYACYAASALTAVSAIEDSVSSVFFSSLSV